MTDTKVAGPVKGNVVLGKNLTNLYIKNTPPDNADMLHRRFDSFGTITSSCIKQDGLGRTFAFVNYARPCSAQQALAAMHAKVVTDHMLYVNMAERREVRRERLYNLYTCGI